MTLVATAAAAAATLTEVPASLMLPRAPAPGKRILLERITPIWSRLSFSWKVTFRNLFRYKRRLAMTIIGIAGCTALLLTGLGLHDSIWDIIAKQFEGDDPITRYTVVVGTDDPSVLDEVEATGNALAIDSMLVHVEPGDEGRLAISEALDGDDAVETVVFDTETVDAYRKSLSSVNLVVVVLVIAAAALAFIVLYNLINIQLIERTREIASLKVLGFDRREVAAYLFRETVLLVIVGALVGLAPRCCDGGLRRGDG